MRSFTGAPVPLTGFLTTKTNEMKTYNGLNVPRQIKTSNIISAFANEIAQSKIEEYTQVLKEEMQSHSFPPIMGYPSIIGEDDFGNYFLTGEEITDAHSGLLVWYVTDGHHRSLAAIEAGLTFFSVELDYSTITSEIDLNNFKNS